MEDVRRSGLSTAGSIAEAIARLSANIGTQSWLRTERELRLFRDPLMKITLPKLKFLEDEQS
jgi:hypothetical protein